LGPADWAAVSAASARKVAMVKDFMMIKMVIKRWW
jgi:hypothetical protein